MEMKSFVISALVENHFGVLSKVAGMFARRGYNIDSLNVGTTKDPSYSRMTIISKGDEHSKQQSLKQLLKLQDTVNAEILSPETSILREHILLKLKNSETSLNLIKTFGASAVYESESLIIAELVAKPSDLDMLIKTADKNDLIQVCRAGALALSWEEDEICKDR